MSGSPLRSPDREVLRRQGAPIRRGIRGTEWFVFTCHECPFTRTYGTEQGAVTGAAEHMLRVHRLRLTLKAAGRTA